MLKGFKLFTFNRMIEEIIKIKFLCVDVIDGSGKVNANKLSELNRVFQTKINQFNTNNHENTNNKACNTGESHQDHSLGRLRIAVGLPLNYQANRTTRHQ